MFRTIVLSLLALAFLGCCNCPKPVPVQPQQEVVVVPQEPVKPEEPKVEEKPEVKPEEKSEPNRRKDRREDRREDRTFPRL